MKTPDDSDDDAEGEVDDGEFDGASHRAVSTRVE